MTVFALIQKIKAASPRQILGGVTVLALALGIVFRFYHITRSDFVLYDEGYYLNYNYRLGEFLAANPINNFSELGKAIYAFICASLATGKTLWFLLVDSRWFFGGLNEWYVARVWAAVFGLLVFIPTYFFAKRFYNSRSVALLAVILLSVLPSQVFYSRIGLQETLSAVTLMAGFYFFIFPRKFGWQTFVAGAFFGAAYFSNYRLIMLPLLVGVAEAWQSLALREKPQLRKFLWCILVFLSCVFFVGNIGNGINTRVVFSWMFHQAQLAESEFDLINFFSYPYYVFRLETVLFGLAFFAGNLYLVFKKQWLLLLPFVLVLLQMLFFSFASEKGARYLCAVMPLMVISVAYVLMVFWQCQKDNQGKLLSFSLAAIMLLGMAVKSGAIAAITSDNRTVIQDLAASNPQAKILTTQPYVQSLYAADRKNIMSAPHNFESVVLLSGAGYRYLLIDPQAYISWTKGEKRFAPELDGYMGFLVKAIKPQKVYTNFSDVMLERFVFEQSDHLLRSIAFLRLAKAQQLGAIRVYDLSQAVPEVFKLISESHGRGRKRAE